MHSLSRFYILLSVIVYSGYVENCMPFFQYFPNEVSRAVVILKGSFNGSEITGVITFTQTGFNGDLAVTGNITGLTMVRPNQKHGLHIHQQAITSTASDNTRCGSTGGHFNPLNMTHGNITDTIRHVGDYGNFDCLNGIIQVNFVDTVSKLYGSKGIIGRSMVLHQLEDDLGGNPISTTSLINGNAGSRIACGIVGILEI